MCGIAGWLGHLPEGQQVAGRIMHRLHHRGPDGRGFRHWPEATLVHTRLSIIDLSPAGAQPMSNEDGTVWAVLNGEIYNHRELQHELAQRGHQFRGRSDTEVLPHLYEEMGSELVTRLRGMFALAIYDTRAKTLLLARDRFGIKPLFYAPGHRRLAFASEINALWEVPGIDRQPDRQAVYDFAALFCIPAPETFYKGIRSLEPGQLLNARFDNDELRWRIQPYHRWSIAPNPTLTLDGAAACANELVATAVQRQLESDVPLGALLSGGIDSSLVSAAAQSGVNGGLRTFNVRFPDNGYDETWAALAVAKHIGSHHLTLDINENRGTWQHLTGLLRHAGQPFADTSLFAVHAVCRLMRQYVTVALSGDGGDEGFGGYDVYWQLARIERLLHVPVALWNGARAGLAPLAHFSVVPAHLPQRLQDLAGADDTAVVQNLFCWLREDEQQRLCLNGETLPIRRLFERQWTHDLPAKASRLERLSALATEANIRLILPNDFLFKVDTASMRESLEVRVPMLDEELMAFGLTLPHRLKVKGRTCKLVLREVAARHLPAVVASKPKLGFGIPVDLWVDADFKTRLRETLLDSPAGLSEFFRPEIYRPWVEAFCSGRRVPEASRQGLYQRVIMLLAVHLALSQSGQAGAAKKNF